MKQLAATVSKQRGIQYEFGPEYEEYCAKKAAGILDVTHIKPLSEMFSEDQLEAIPIDNKVGENYFGQMTNQLRAKGGTAFKAISEVKCGYCICRWCRENVEGQRVEKKAKRSCAD